MLWNQLYAKPYLKVTKNIEELSTLELKEDPFDEEYFSNFDVGFDLDEEGYRILSSKIIVEEVESEDHQISLLEVKQVADDAQIGDTVVLDVTPEKEDFGRMAAINYEASISSKVERSTKKNDSGRIRRFRRSCFNCKSYKI